MSMSARFQSGHGWFADRTGNLRCEHLFPNGDVLFVGVDKRSVDVEQNCLDGHHYLAGNNGQVVSALLE
jgi:hypothetical protein